MGFVDVPIFTGDGLRDWIDWLHDYFDRENYMDIEKLNFSKSFMEGKARSWLRQRQSTRIFQTWDDLRDALLIRFGEEDDPERIRLLLDLERDWKHSRESANKWSHDPQHELPVSLSESDGDKKSLGYRYHQSACESRNSLSKNMDVPRFNGTSLFLWLLRIEKYFQSFQVVEDERLGRLSKCLQGEAFFWFKMELFYGGFSSWCEFKRRIVARFAPVRRCSRPAVTTKPIMMSQTDEVKESSPANELRETEKTAAEDSIQKLVVEVAHEKIPASQPSVSKSVLESCHNEKRLKDFGYTSIPLVQKQVLIVLVDDLSSEVDTRDEKPPGVLRTHSASKVFDTLPLKTEMINMKMEQDKLSKSWKFKFKQRDVIAEDDSLDAVTSFDKLALLHERKANSIVEALDLQKEVILQKEQVFAKTEPVLEIAPVKALGCSSPTRLLKHVSTSEFVHATLHDAMELIHVKGTVPATDHEEELVFQVSAVEELSLVLQEEVVVKKELVSAMALETVLMQYLDSPAVEEFHRTFGSCDPLMLPDTLVTNCSPHAVWITEESVQEIVHNTDLGRKKQFTKNWMFKYKDTRTIQVAKGLIQVLQAKLLKSWRFKYKATKQHVNFLFLTSLCDLWNTSCSHVWHRWRYKAKTTHPVPKLLTFGLVNETKFFSVWHRWRIRDCIFVFFLLVEQWQYRWGS